MSKRQKGPLPYPAPGIGAAWLGDSAAFGFGDGMMKLGEAMVRCHDGGMLAMQASSDGQSIWTSGDDGRLVQVDSQGQVHERLHVPRKWLDSLAISADGSLVAVAAWRAVTGRACAERAVAVLARRPVAVASFIGRAWG